MKALPLAFLVMVASPLWADPAIDLSIPPAPVPTPPPAVSTNPTLVASPTPAAEVPWSIVGKWDGHDVAWTGSITISADGTFAWSNGTGGHWTLTGLQDHLVLVLAWDDYPAETLTMYGPSDFRGKTMQLNRPSAPNTSLFGPIETRTWRQGEPPVRIMPQADGFCALSLVTGHFQGGGEVVRVYIGKDGYWYLGGQSGQEGVAAQCIVVRYAR
jgi:hypothetical protein